MIFRILKIILIAIAIIMYEMVVVYVRIEIL
jgi:hypothetical protein